MAMGVQPDIFKLAKEGTIIPIRLWLDNTENDLNQVDDHWFTPLHWAARQGHKETVELLIDRGARVTAKNRGDDTPLHNAAQCGHLEVTKILIRHKARVNERNEHGNSPLHYACFGNYAELALLLIDNGAMASLSNKYGHTPLEKARRPLAEELCERAKQLDQDLTTKIPYESNGLLYQTTKPHTIRLQDKHNDLDMQSLFIKCKISQTKACSVLRGKWNDSDVVVKLLNLPKSLTQDPDTNEIKPLSSRHLREFQEEYAKTRIFSHQNLLPALGIVNKISPPSLAIVSQWMPVGSLYKVLHDGKGIPVVDNAAIQNFAVDIARGMKFLHDMQPTSAPKFHLNSKNIVIDEDQNARLNLGDSHFSIQGNDKIYDPAWMAPEVLAPIGNKVHDYNRKKADMWSFAIVLWEMVTHEVPFKDLLPMQIGIRVAHENLRVPIPNGITPNMAELIKICMKDEPTRRPNFEQIVPILAKMADN